MTLVVSTHAVFDEATGELLFMAPEELCPLDKGRVALPDGFADWSHEWDASARTFVIDLDAFKAAARAEVKIRREQHEFAGIDTPHGPIDTDADSQRKIGGAVQMALILGEAFTIAWRRADDEVVELDAAAMISVGLLVGQHVSACQQRKNELDEEIAEAANISELDAIDLEAGWPA